MKIMEIKLPQLDCKRCGHIWVPRVPDVRECPKCRSSWWDTPKPEKKKNNHKAKKDGQ